jgi:hypothetical protein
VNDPLAGGCQCGAVRFVARGPVHGTFVCHCTECRRQSASAFGVSVDVDRDGLSLLAGTTRSWRRSIPSGALVCHFCPTCGSRLWHDVDPPQARVTLKGGALDAPPDLRRAVHIWTRRKLPGVILPADAEQHPGEAPQRSPDG